jgi:hypothetical protein
VEHSDRKRVRREKVARSSWQRPRPAFIAELLAHPVYSLASRINAEYFEAVARRRAVSSLTLHWPVLRKSIGLSQRLAVVCRGHLSAPLVQKLIRFRSERAFHASAPYSCNQNELINDETNTLKSIMCIPLAFGR